MIWTMKTVNPVKEKNLLRAFELANTTALGKLAAKQKAALYKPNKNEPVLPDQAYALIANEFKDEQERTNILCRLIAMMRYVNDKDNLNVTKDIIKKAANATLEEDGSFDKL